MEMALNQTRNFGYTPDELITFIGSHGDYRFYRINESSRTLVQIDGFARDDIGANVLCMPETRNRSLGRFKNWLR